MRKKIKLIKLCCVFSFMLFSIGIYAQQKTITGSVKDDNGETLIGVLVSTSDAKIGVATDPDGKYSIQVPSETKTLKFSFVGMRPQEIKIDGSVINVVLKDEYSNLNEVVVIGYGTAKRGELTGAISSVDEKILKEAPVASSVEAISGRLAGVNITKTEGSPDAEIMIRVRGGGSITQDNSPLFIVDGFPAKTIADISPRDIQSIDVLKDASSTAIYGAEGANGVIIVTTKKGNTGRVNINFNAYRGFSKVYNLTEVLSPYEFVYLQRELDSSASLSTGFFSTYGLWEDIDIYKSKKGNDWQKEVFGNTGVHQNYNVSATGGTEKISYLVSLTHDDETYIMNRSEFSRDNINFRLNSSLNNNIDFDFTTRLSHTVIDGPSISNGKKLRESIKFAPVRGLSDLNEESLLEESGSTIETIGNLKNPMSNVDDEYKKQKQLRNTFNAGLTWKIIKPLRFRTQFSYELVNNYTDNIWIKGAGESSANGGFPVAKRVDEKGNAWSFQNTLTFNKTFGDIHRLEVLGGQEMKHYQINSMQSQSKFYPIDMSAENVLANWDKGKPLPTYTTEEEPERMFSYFGRINYTLKDKYIFTFNTRYDGKNSFAPGQRWGFFPGGAGAWRVSKEQFMEQHKDWLSNLKLRLSYGLGGNARVKPNWRQLYSTVTTANKLYYPNEDPASALQPSNILKNENLTWESKLSSNIGIDFGFLNERFSGTVDIYSDKTRDLILQVLIPVHSGFNYQFQNIGETSNKGVEISLNGYLVDNKDFKLSANFNIAFNRNKVLKYASDEGKYALISSGTTGSDYDFYVEEGREIGLMYGFETEGLYSFDDFTWNDKNKKWDLNQKDANGNLIPDINTYASLGNNFGPGTLKLKDLNGDGKITTADRKIIGKAQPKHTGGFGLNAQYKGFDLQTLFNWSYGNDILNANKIDNTSYAGSKRNQNLSTDMNLANRFTTIDPETGYNIYYGAYANPERLKELNEGKTMWHPFFNTTYLHSWAIEDGSFLRLSNLTVGYTLPNMLAKKMMMQNLRLYLTAYNVYCWTNYSGQDPEVGTRSSSPLTPGVDYSAYPKSRSYLVGVSVTF